MKKLDLRILLLTISVLGIFLPSNIFAQNAKMQWINNAAGIELDTIDVYVDGNKIADDLTFRSATTILNGTAGAHVININNATSVDSGDMVLSRLALNTVAGSNNIIMIAGVENPSNYANNPAGRSTDIQLIVRKGVLFSTSTSTTTAVSFFNGVTDNEGVNITTRPTGAVINVAKLKFRDTTGTITPNAVETFIDIRDTTGNNVSKSYLIPLNAYAKKALTIFTSGFMTPANNQNGLDFGVFAVDTNGNTIKLVEASRIQFINNAPDVILDSVDIWLNNTKVSSKLGYTKATTTLTVVSGTYTITVTKKNSPDTTGSNVVYQIPAFNFVGGTTYLGLLSGVVDTTQYKTNPDGIDRSFNLTVSSNYSEFSGVSNQTAIRFFNAVPDAGMLTIQRTPAAPTTLYGPISFNSISTASNLSSAGIQILLEKLSTEINKSYRLNLTNQGGKSGVLSATGFIDTVGNKTGSAAKLYKYILTLSDGTQLNLTSLTSKMQVIHSSADVTLAKVKLFMNGTSIADTLSFRTAIAAKSLIAYKNYRFHISPLGSADTTTALYSFNLLPDSGKFYYAVPVGVINTANYKANPNGVDRAFTVLINANGKEKATFNSKNVDLLYLNALTDAPATTAKGVGQTLYLSKNDMYKAFHGYNSHSAFNNIIFDLLDATEDTTLLTCLANLTDHKGEAGLVVASGFISPKDNQNGAGALLFVTWPNGVTDSLPLPYTGLKNNVLIASEITTYPVPANDQVTVTLNIKKHTALHTEIIDITGKVVLEQDNKLSRGNNTLQLNTSSFPAGFYMIKLAADNETYTKKINIIR